MQVYILRLNDGTCQIGEADSESQACKEFVSCRVDSAADPELILSVRELPKNTFLSKWRLAEFPDDHSTRNLTIGTAGRNGRFGTAYGLRKAAATSSQNPFNS